MEHPYYENKKIIPVAFLLILLIPAQSNKILCQTSYPNKVTIDVNFEVDKGPLDPVWAYPPKDYEKWAELVYRGGSHSVERHGAGEQGSPLELIALPVQEVSLLEISWL